MHLPVVTIFSRFCNAVILGCKYHPVCEKGTCSPTQTVFSYKQIHLPHLTQGRLVTKGTELCMVLYASPTCRPTTPPRDTITGTCKNRKLLTGCPLHLYLGARPLQMHQFVFCLGRMLPRGQEDTSKITLNWPTGIAPWRQNDTEVNATRRLRGQETLPGIPYEPPCDSVSPG